MATARNTPTPDTTPTPPTAPTPEVEAKAAPVVVPFPRSPAWVKKNDPAQAETLSIWARQEKEGIITLCNHKDTDAEGNEARCYFPAVNVRDGSNSPIFEKDNEGKTYGVGKCSYAGELHPPIKMYPKKKEDEI